MRKSKNWFRATFELIQKLVSGDFNGKDVSSESRLRKIPVSSSVRPERAMSFGYSTYLEIKRKTSTSNVLNSSWGTSEYEMVTNPLSRYKVVEAVETYDDITKMRGVILRLEEIVD